MYICGINFKSTDMSNRLISSASYADTKPHYNILDGLRGAAALMVMCKVQEGVGNGSHAGCQGNRGASSLQGGQAFLQHAVCRIGETDIRISLFFIFEQLQAALVASEFKRRGLINRNGLGTKMLRWIITGVQLPRGKTQCIVIKCFVTDGNPPPYNTV